MFSKILILLLINHALVKGNDILSSPYIKFRYEHPDVHDMHGISDETVQASSTDNQGVMSINAEHKFSDARKRLRPFDSTELTTTYDVKISQDEPRTFDIGHKLMGDHQSAEQLSVENQDEVMKKTQDSIYTLDNAELMTTKEDSLKRLSMQRVEENEDTILDDEQAIHGITHDNKYIPEMPRVIEIDAIVQEPEQTEETSSRQDKKEITQFAISQDAPSGRRLKAYELSPSALPLVAGLPHDSAQLQLLTDVPHHIFIHPPKVYPITPSPELSGPLLGGPRIINKSVVSLLNEKKDLTRRQSSGVSQTYTRHIKPVLGRALSIGSPVQGLQTFPQYYYQRDPRYQSDYSMHPMIQQPPSFAVMMPGYTQNNKH